MDSRPSKTCLFCNKVYTRLGNHYKYCPERNGKEYEHLLSQKTLDIRQKTVKKLPCPNCGKLFKRLENHLRNSATSKHSSSLSESDPVTEIYIQPSQKKSHDYMPSPFTPSTKEVPSTKTLPRLLLPKRRLDGS